MERTGWTDERLDEKMAAIDHTFDRIDDDLGDLRSEMRELRREFREEMRAMRLELKEEIAGMRSDLSDLQGRLVQIGFGLVGALVMSLIALLVALV
jgi:chromosome segregation ATPase